MQQLWVYIVGCFSALLPRYKRLVNDIFPADASVCMIYMQSLSVHHLLAVTHTQPFCGSLDLSGTTRVSQYQKKHSPTYTYCGCQSSLICFLHLLRSMVSWHSAPLKCIIIDKCERCVNIIVIMWPWLHFVNLWYILALVPYLVAYDASALVYAFG